MNSPKKIITLAPFCRRAGILVTGRKKLELLGNKIAFILVANDISANSLDEVLETFPSIPVVQWGTSNDFHTLFDLENTKIIGVKRSSLAEQIFADMQDEKL